MESERMESQLEVELVPGKSSADFWLSTLLSRLLQTNTCSPKYLSTLQNERAAVASLLLILDARINLCAPVSRLPPEVMGHIFSYLLSQERRERIKVVGHVSRTVPWIRLTHVCRHWRQVFLNNASLWRHIVLPLPPQWSNALLERSRNAPLIITCSPKPQEEERRPAPVQLPIATLEHVQHIDTIGYEGSRRSLVELLRTPAPLLEIAHVDDISATDLFADSAPGLRELKMFRAQSLPWTASFLPNLVTLSLTSLFISDPPVAECIAGLQRLSRIQTLHLINCLGPFSSLPQPSDTSQTVTLPSLRTLWITGTLEDCVGFLRHMHTPNIITLHVSSHMEGVSESAPLYPFLAPLHGYAADPFCAIEFSSTANDAVTVTARHAIGGPINRVFEFSWY
ncbi:hypothetical protein FA95DRAFT_1561207, partial [Auriscalpium vulgare]